MMIRQSDGFVGIGTEAPIARLDVNGDVVIAGSIINDAIQLPVLQNNWVNYDAGFEQAGYFKDKFGIVHLKGLVCSGSSAVIMTLPEGYRPAGQLLFTVVSGNGFARIDVLNNGEVKLIGTYDSEYVSLTGISFRVN